MKSLLVFFLLTIANLQLLAQVPDYSPLDTQDPVYFKGKYFIYQNDTTYLGPQAFYIDGQLSDQEAARWPFVFNSVHQAAQHLTDGTEEKPMVLYIAPYVYWIDDPDDSEIRVPKEGAVPYGLEIKCEWLKFYGLNKKPENVILACNRGQTIGAKGNFTLFRFDGLGTSSENITFGNYCNVDLKYPLKPALNRRRRANAIVQAQLIHCNGDKILARNTHFISRLNLCPFVGGKRVFFDQCHFESTDDALCGTAVYKNSTLEFYSSKPFYHTTGTGAVFLNCDITSFTDGEQYFTKVNGQVAVIDTRFHSESMSYIGWRDEPPASMKNYQYNVTLNGKPISIGKKDPESTVDLDGKPLLHAYRFMHQDTVVYNTYNLLKGNDDWDPEGIKKLVLEAEKKQVGALEDIPVQLNIHPSKSSLETKKDTARLETEFLRFGNFNTHDYPVEWQLSQEGQAYVKLLPGADGETLKVIPINTSNKPQSVTLTATTSLGLEGASELELFPAKLSPPNFKKKPEIKMTGKGTLRVDYSFENLNYADQSLVSWYRCKDQNGSNAIKVAVSRMDKPYKIYHLSPGDVGYFIMAKVFPKHLRSDPGNPQEVVLTRPIQNKDVKSGERRLVTDFNNQSVENQTRVIPGFWTFDHLGAHLKFDRNNPGNAWFYGEGTGGAKGKIGLLQTGRAASMSYTPVGEKFEDMKAKILVSPHKTAGQGFSVAPLYMDILIKYDARTKSGFGLRLTRTTKFANSVDCYFVKYDQSEIIPISEPVSTSCFRAPCQINLEVSGNKIKAHMECLEEYDKSKYPDQVLDEVQISAPIEPDSKGGFGIEYQGGSTTMINKVELNWGLE
ncbi:hypothetical protein QWY93_12455 [Echinicola jeungdonensis]|uniref:Uncharacterized protein n=1 Tax=Echinicola jeungdonensis TaxID=709343 RepID=A0ABV5J2K8_9BACT|nr:hypothetical protein [Echinicola jeungdonensis]MDN3670137.1 hypothetical protein [Echinicola jeungdonensis]